MTKSTRGRRSTMACRTVDAIIRVQELGPDLKDIPNSLQNNVLCICELMHSPMNNLKYSFMVNQCFALNGVSDHVKK